MNLLAPQDEPLSLPRSCYFLDGKTKVDYILVYPRLDDQLNERNIALVNKFVSQMKEKGLLVEQDLGKFHKTLVFVKVHGPHKVLVRYASIYNIDLTCQNPYYKYQETILLKCMTTELTRPNDKSEVYQRAIKTLSGTRPFGLTTLERSLIVYEIIKRINFTFEDDDEVTLKDLLAKEVFLQAYAIHDGDYTWSSEGSLTDRQLLFAFWANIKYTFREQPIHLIEKYYGPKIAFYFALASFYTKMLLVPTLIGIITVIVGWSTLYYEGSYIDEEICESTITLCSDQELKTACQLMKIAYVIDNPATIFYVILCSFWGAVFWNLWQRRQAMLRLRWNLMKLKADRTMRKEFQESAWTRRSSITGEVEFYIPPFKKVLMSIFTYFTTLLMVCIFLSITWLLIEYRFFLRKQLDYDEVSHSNEIELFTSSIITSVIILLLNECNPLILKLYSRIIRFLTFLRQPRTQIQYNRMYLHMMFILTFANHFAPLFYLAYMKGFFHTYPGDTSESSFISRIQEDLCKPAGCLVDLAMQLITIMVFKTVTKSCYDLVDHFSAPWQKFKVSTDSELYLGQWENDYVMKEFNQGVIDQLYTNLVLQYSFITFFNAALPVIGLVALIHNMLRIQHDAYRFLKLYRRPVLEKTPDIEGWNQILKIVTVLGTISNAFVVAFRTDFILRVLYRKSHDGTLKGYVNSTLSKFSIKDIKNEDLIIDHENDTHCFYRGKRFPPEHEKKYQPTLEHWHHLAIKAIYFIVLENVTLCLSLILGYLIPEVPRKVKVKLEYDEKMLKAAREKQLEQTNV